MSADAQQHQQQQQQQQQQGDGPQRPASPPPPPDKKDHHRVRIAESEAGSLSAGEWASRWRQQEAYVTGLERKLALQEGELVEVRQGSERVRQQCNEAQQRERVLVRRLAAKEQETQDYVLQLNELKGAQAPAASSLRNALLDPAVNSLLQQMRTELQATRLKLEDTQNELTAWKFTPDSNTGKRLMAKCRLLYQENEELGKMTSSGRLAKLETDLALQKSFSEEVRQSQNELDSFLADLDEDVEGMQSTIMYLQQELKKAKDAMGALQKENGVLRNGRANGESGSSGGAVSEQLHQKDQHQRTEGGGGDGGGGGGGLDSDSEGERTRVKRVRRSSVLSIDYNEDDTLVINTNGDVAMGSDPE